MSSILRFQIVGEAFKKKPVEVPNREERPSEFFAKYVFTRQKMQKYLPAEVYKKMCDVIDGSAVLDMATADAVAAGMKKWAMELGVTHCTHWFQPLTEGTAEKHDGFVEHDGKGGMVEEFTGKQLVQQEPDASSFPSGGIRSTFEARGYSAWDPASPVFVIGDTLMIPTIFISYTGEALDYKAPLKKALKAVDKAATAVAQYFYPDVTKVISNLGWEQEYFLVDEGLYAARPDLLMTGRTLLGHDSAKNQQMDDHYLGSIPMRVAAFMKDLEIQALELGIPCKTRHNEVAPNQFELAPIYEETNLAVDHNMLIMSLMKRTARKHGFRCLLHEKPFAGINGSGKHCNWSLATNTGVLLHGPGKTPLDNLRFVTFIVESLMAVYRHNGLMKASIISATNVHRLGASEAPPAIVSSFLGKTLGELLDQLETTDSPFLSEGGVNLDAEAPSPLERVGERLSLSLDIPQIPELMQDDTDRNRTSPFAFTGNRFEFRAVGSQQNCAAAMIVLNTAMAEALTDFKVRVDALIAQGTEPMKAILHIVREDIKTCKPIRFDGNGYSEAWKQEAARRGLNVETSAPIILDQYLAPDTVEMFARMNVMRPGELVARNEIKLETYTKKIQIEARIFGDLCMNHIIPTSTRYQSQLIDNVHKTMEIFPAETAERLNRTNLRLIEQMSEHNAFIIENVEQLIEARRVANRIQDEREKAIAYHDTVAPLIEKIRYHVDHLELIVDDELWPLPKYREMLFIR
ncbi:MAG: glutamine synthetase III [Bacteroidaceae bacterium]|nr:glutamine synthetase III [Bacteroidaceae bacterium]